MGSTYDTVNPRRHKHMFTSNIRYIPERRHKNHKQPDKESKKYTNEGLRYGKIDNKTLLIKVFSDG